MLKRTGFIFFILLQPLLLAAQLTGAQVAAAVSPGGLLKKASFNDTAAIKEFYTYRQFQPAWFGSRGAGNRQILLQQLAQADSLGLEPRDYQYDFIQRFIQTKQALATIQDSLTAELFFTGAALHFYKELAQGNQKPVFGYDGLQYTPACIAVANELASHLANGQLPALAAKLTPALPEINALIKAIGQWRSAVQGGEEANVPVSSKTVSTANRPLLTKLYLLGLLDTTRKNITADSLKAIIKEAQRRFDALADGVLRTPFLQQLNVPPATRLRQLKLALNYYRWLHCLARQQAVITVNIPAAYLKVYNGGAILLEMRLVVGKPSTPTPTLNSRVSEVILYPYWHVPYSIATKELLPRIQRNPAYINEGNYQVLNMAGQVMNPYTIHWRGLSTRYFPYIIRQGSGCDNALGILKLNFLNPYSVYLHDTPGKNSFSMGKRYFSHGCMRMQKPMELGYLVMNRNRLALDTISAKGCVQNQQPVVVEADVKMPVVVWYNPVGTDSAGRVVFFDDIYHKFSWPAPASAKR
jgi:L,D-transpeptidase YcbB